MRKKSKFSLIGKILGAGLLLIWTLFPIYWMFSLSLRADSELSGRLPFFSRTFSFHHFHEIFRQKAFGLAVRNSLQVTLSALVFSLLFGLLCAYVLSRKRFRFLLKKPTMFWVLLVRVLPPIAFAIPLYTMMNRLGILHTRIPITLSHILICIPFIIWFMISFFAGLPEEIEESAAVDGATEWQLFVRIVLPLVLPGITAVSILSFMTSWNEYLYGVIFVQSPSKFTIPLTLSTLNSEQEMAQWGNIAAGGVISLIPIALFVIFAQNYLISGLSSGAVKE